MYIASPFSQTILTRTPLVPISNQLVVQKTYQWWHLAFPTVSVPNATYRIGSGFTGGFEDQLAGSLLGEIVINQHWSIQTGIRLLYSQGFHYRDEQDFDDHQKGNFRQTYAPLIPITADIEDIGQESVTAQVPVQLAYHYLLSRKWSLRLGIGTDLDLGTRSTVSYKYGDNSHSSDRGLTHVRTPVRVLNNLTLTPSMEWYRERWLLRAGPFISPQLRSVNYKPDDLYWGANIQVLYQLGR